MRPDFIETFTGKRIRPLEPVVADICIEDIAHHLSLRCRFSCATAVMYCVAQHSVLLSELLESWGCSKEIQFWGLHHDDGEAFLPDIPSPVKGDPIFEGYRRAEARWMVAVCRRFGMPIAEPERVRTADLVMQVTEKRDLMPNKPEHWAELDAKVKPLQGRIIPWESSTAEILFLKRHGELAA